MKKHSVYILFVISVVFGSCMSKKQDTVPHTYTISGVIKGLGNENLYARIPDESSSTGYRTDTIKVVNDTFKYSDSVEVIEKREFYSRQASLIKKVNKGYIPSKANLLALYVFPGAEITIEGEAIHYMNAFPSGDSINTKLNELNKRIYPTLNQIADIKVNAFNEKDTTIKKALHEKASKMHSEVLSIKKQFIEDYPNAVASVDVLLEMVSRKQIEDADAIRLFSKLSTSLKNITSYKVLQQRINGIKDTQVGQEVVNINTNATLNGEVFNLKSYAGKFVIIDFWGTWCAPCVSEMPELSEYYNEHKDRLEVVGVNSGDSKKRIQNFLNKNESYKWVQILSSKTVAANDFVSQFNVTNFPTKIIIDPNGKIIKKVVGYHPEMYDFLNNEMAKYYSN